MMNLTKQPVAFKCPCGQTWYAPPQTFCPDCGPYGPAAEPEDYVWEIHEVLPGLFITAQMRDQRRFEEMASAHRPSFVIDLAGDFHYIWRPDPQDFARLRIGHYRLDGIIDDGKPFSPKSLDAFMSFMSPYHTARARTVVQCAAGLRRAPHFVYAYLRQSGRDPIEAWDLVEQARTRAFMHTPYIESIETWLSS
jgi:hypothetical protein